MSKLKNNFLTNYLVGSWSELKKVSWPKTSEVINHTVIVLISCAVAIAITSAIDYGLTYLVQYIVERRG